jgi:hypothetical protein
MIRLNVDGRLPSRAPSSGPNSKERPRMSETGPTVFVVDDDVSVRESLKPLIESAGWRAETFGSGRRRCVRATHLSRFANAK